MLKNLMTFAYGAAVLLASTANATPQSPVNNTIIHQSSAPYFAREEWILSDPNQPNLSYNTLEDKLYYENHHFLTLISHTQDNRTSVSANIYAIRTHPGDDPDGWGTTLYLQSFIPDQNYNAKLDHTDHPITIIVKKEEIEINASGKISYGLTNTFGNWNSQLFIRFNYIGEIASVTGTYDLSLDNYISTLSRSFNLFRIASNYLTNVPLLDGSIGDTGDMKRADVYFDDIFQYAWIPPLLPGHYPGEQTKKLTINVVGDFNRVDTLALGDPSAIKPAFKPSLKVTMDTKDDEKTMSFGGFYDQAQSQRFNADNVGITPLLSGPTKDFHFDVEISSESIEQNRVFEQLFKFSLSWQKTRNAQDLIELLVR